MECSSNNPTTDGIPHLHDHNDTTRLVCHGIHDTMPDQRKVSGQVRKDNSL
jgi:hypothetical protein